MRVATLVFMAIAFGGLACGDNLKGSSNDDAGPNDAGTALVGCLDRPEDLARAPSGTLPCDLVPPGRVINAP